ncbi:alpha/beta fold hydrolase [Clostridium sp. Marseille-QA1073]
MEERTFNTRQVSLNYVEKGTSDISILLLHGGSSRWQTFRDIIDDLSVGFHVYALDLRGHGKSGRTEKMYKIQDYVPDVKEFIEKCIEKPAIIIGHSLGGMIAILLAAYYPSMVKALIIGDSPISLDVLRSHSESQKEMTMLWREWSKNLSIGEIVKKLKAMQVPMPGGERTISAAEAYGENHPWFKFMAENLKQNDTNMLTAIIDDFDNTYEDYDVERLFPLIKCPTLIIKGDSNQGSLIRDNDINLIKTLNSNVKHIEIEGVGHALYMQDKQSFIDAILSFINENVQSLR